MLHEDLQPKFAVAMALPDLMKHRWFLRLATLAANLTIKSKNVEGLNCTETSVASRDDGYAIRVRVYRPTDHTKDTSKLPVMLYIHGGGYIAGMPEIAHSAIEQFIKTRPCVLVAPDYRKALTKPYPAGLNDCYDTILWARENAHSLGIDPDKVVVAGHSAGGGLAAAVTLKARDTQDFPIAFQLPIYPMIDDAQPDDPERAIDSPAWNTTMNKLGWQSYLADLIKTGSEIPAYAAPIRNTDYSGFPPTITFVGTLEPFYSETVRYVDALGQAGVTVAYKEYEGCFHGFDSLAGDTAIGRDALDFTYSNYADFYDRYFDSQTDSACTQVEQPVDARL